MSAARGIPPAAVGAEAGARSPYLVDRLRAAAAQHQQRTALVDGDRTLTFGELDRASDRMASVLAARGVGRGDRVAIVAPKSAATSTVIWATLKLGAAFVPANTEWSRERLEGWVQDCEPAALVVEDAVGRDLLASLLGRPAPAAIRVLTGMKELEGQAAEATAPFTPPPQAGPEDAAYVYYTSGTTGAPKGAIVSHAAAASTIDHFVDRLRLTPEDRLLNTVPLHLDRSVFEIVGHVTAGCANILMPGIAMLSRIFEVTSRQGVTVLSTAPSVLRALAANTASFLARYPMKALRAALFGGERTASRTIADLARALPAVRWFQGYGTTETVMQSLLCELDGRTLGRALEGCEFVPLGEPFPDSDVTLLDDEGRPVKAGLQGEIVVGGRTMREYWRQPEATRKRLRPAPFGGGRELTAWHTGDVAYRDPEGRLHFCGRRDNLVKIRGERVQLEQIDAALSALPGVLDGAAVAVESAEEGPRVIGFVVPGADSPEDGWQQALPRSLAPEQVLRVGEIPRGAGGKIDRPALRQLFQRARQRPDGP